MKTFLAPQVLVQGQRLFELVVQFVIGTEGRLTLMRPPVPAVFSSHALLNAVRENVGVVLRKPVILHLSPGQKRSSIPPKSP